MAKISPSILDTIEPIFKSWVKDVFFEIVPTLIQVQNPEPLNDRLPEYLSPTESCTLLGLSLPTLRKHTKAGIYTAYRVGNRKIQYRRSEIEKAIHARRIDHLIKTR